MWSMSGPRCIRLATRASVMVRTPSTRIPVGWQTGDSREVPVPGARATLGLQMESSDTSIMVAGHYRPTTQNLLKCLKAIKDQLRGCIRRYRGAQSLEPGSDQRLLGWEILGAAGPLCSGRLLSKRRTGDALQEGSGGVQAARNFGGVTPRSREKEWGPRAESNCRPTV